MKSQNTKGIIYRIYNSGQSDKIIYVIDTEGSKNIFLAKGAKKSTSKKAHSIELCNFVDIKGVTGYNIPVVTEIRVLDEYIQWKNDKVGMLIIQMFCEIIDKLCYEDNKDKDLYSIISEILKNYTSNILILTNVFLLKILWHTGSMPSITTNAITGYTLNSENLVFCNQVAGYITKEDLSRDVSLIGEQIPSRLAKSQKFIIENNIQKSFSLMLTTEDLYKMIQIELDWFEILTEQRLKSKGIILTLVNKLSKQI